MSSNPNSSLFFREQAIASGLVSPQQLVEMNAVIFDAVREVSESILLPQQATVSAENKHAFGLMEPVTEVDRRISKILLERVGRYVPGSYSEEDMPAQSADRRTADLLWQFDPLDGTQEYIEGFTNGVAIQGALLARFGEHYHPISGFIYRPGTRVLWYTDECGRPHYERDGAPLLLPSLARDQVLRGGTRKVEPDANLNGIFTRLADRLGEDADIFETGGAGAHFCDLLDGTIDVFVANTGHSKAWDVAMGICLVEARGGFVCDRFGQPISDLNAHELRNVNGFVASIVYGKDELLPLP